LEGDWFLIQEVQVPHPYKRRLAAFLATMLSAVVLLSLAMPAFAASPTKKGYGLESPDAQQNSKTKAVETTAAKAPPLGRHALAFTGFNVVLIAGAGLLLAGAGFAIRASTKPGRRES
jgi:hypothetical protein